MSEGPSLWNKPLVLLGAAGLSATVVLLSNLPSAWEHGILRTAILTSLPMFFGVGVLPLVAEGLLFYFGTAFERGHALAMTRRKLEALEREENGEAPPEEDLAVRQKRRRKKESFFELASTAAALLRAAVVVACVIGFGAAGWLFIWPFTSSPENSSVNVYRWNCAIEAFDKGWEVEGVLRPIFSGDCKEIFANGNDSAGP